MMPAPMPRPLARDRRLAAALLVSMALTIGCSSPAPSSSDKGAPQAPAPTAPGGAALWGDMKPIVSVKELMRDMLDPASDFVFDAVKIEFTKGGTNEVTP